MRFCSRRRPRPPPHSTGSRRARWPQRRILTSDVNLGSFGAHLSPISLSLLLSQRLALEPLRGKGPGDGTRSTICGRRGRLGTSRAGVMDVSTCATCHVHVHILMSTCARTLAHVHTRARTHTGARTHVANELWHCQWHCRQSHASLDVALASRTPYLSNVRAGLAATAGTSASLALASGAAATSPISGAVATCFIVTSIASGVSSCGSADELCVTVGVGSRLCTCRSCCSVLLRRHATVATVEEGETGSQEGPARAGDELRVYL